MSAKYKHTLYKGKKQQIYARTEITDAVLIVMYFNSLDELEIGEAVDLAAQSEANAFIDIHADVKQTAIYDRTHKSIEAYAEPLVQIDVSYRKI
jgi:N-acetylmuramoyl-L-alanine amidase